MVKESKITNLPLPITERGHFGFEENSDFKVRCLHCGHVATPKDPGNSGAKVRTLMCWKCDIEDFWDRR